MTQARFRELSFAIVSHAAQLVYLGKGAEAYRLLSAADRLFRCLADPGAGGAAPLAEELDLASSFLEILRILHGLDIELAVDLDEETRSSAFVACGSLVAALDLLAATPVPGAPLRAVLVEGGRGEGGLNLEAGDRCLHLAAGGDE